MNNALLPGLGGPMGRHARPTGIWFNPLPWTIFVAAALFIVLSLRQVPCVQTEASNAINAFIRLCYSDIPVTYMGSEFGLGHSPLGGGDMDFPPVLGVIILGVLQLTRILDAEIHPDAGTQAELDGAQIFYGLTMVLLFIFFLAWAIATAMMGRGSRHGTVRTWDGMLVAASPVVLAAGLIDWNILPIGLSALGLWQFSQRRIPEAGVILGLAMGAASMPVLVTASVAVAVLLRGQWRQLLLFLGTSLITAGLVHLPLLLSDAGRVVAFYQHQIDTETSYGSFWFLLAAMGVSVRASGSLGLMILMLFLGILFSVLYVKQLRPRVGTLIAITVFASALLGATYTPQTALWLLFALVLARPFRTEMVLFTISQLAYYLAVWGWISGALKAEDNGPENLYFLAIFARICVDVLLLVCFHRDVFRPGSDLVRRPDQSDPLGGVLTDGEELRRIGEKRLVGSHHSTG